MVTGAVPTGPCCCDVPAGCPGLRLGEPEHRQSHGVPAGTLPDPPAEPRADPGRLGQRVPADHVQSAGVDVHRRHHGTHVWPWPQESQPVSGVVDVELGWERGWEAGQSGRGEGREGGGEGWGMIVVVIDGTSIGSSGGSSSCDGCRSSASSSSSNSSNSNSSNSCRSSDGSICSRFRKK